MVFGTSVFEKGEKKTLCEKDLSLGHVARAHTHTHTHTHTHIYIHAENANAYEIYCMKKSTAQSSCCYIWVMRPIKVIVLEKR